MVDAIDSHWESEDIPNTDYLYMRVHVNHLKFGHPTVAAFRDYEMSTDWDKYATPHDTQRGGRKEAHEYAVIAMRAGDVRAVPSQAVKHTPMVNNRAHSDVIGDKKTDPEVRIRFSRIYQIKIAGIETT